MKKPNINVLVLGVGGNVSQGILKALAHSQLPHRVIGACVSPLSAGLYMVNHGLISPYADDPMFIDWLLDICHREQIHVILTGVEPILTVLAQHEARLRDACGVRCVVSASDVLAIAGDKLATCIWLRDQGFHYPRFADATDTDAVEELVNTCGFPLIAKPRRGKGSSGITVIRDAAALAQVQNADNMVIQELLGDVDSEYTAGCFSDGDGVVRGCIVMRRTLENGTTAHAEIGLFPEVRAEALRIVQALRPMGPCNIQLRVMADGRPVCFEINARFSGTTPIRAHFGFNDVEAAIRYYVLDEPAYDLPVITSGVVLRYWNEVYVDDASLRELQQTGAFRRDEPPGTVEDYGMG